VPKRNLENASSATPVSASCAKDAEDDVRNSLIEIRPMLNGKPKVSAAVREWFAKFQAALGKADGKIATNSMDFHEMEDAMKAAKTELAF
jgi:hypothetical protein